MAEAANGLNQVDRRARRFYDSPVWWQSADVDPRWPGEDRHPALTSAIFVVHGMGEQRWAETAVSLRRGFEDVLPAIVARMDLDPASDEYQRLINLPSPFIYEGYWADYAQVSAMFPRKWKSFSDHEAAFFQSLWRARASSTKRTLAWYLHQQVRLCRLRVLREVPSWWPLYVALQPIGVVVLGLIGLFRPKLLSRVLGDVRLYCDPRGAIEWAIVQRIDQRVGDSFLRLIGLDREFRPLPPHKQLRVCGRRARFDRVVWAAHSLGSVISFNVLSDLFHRAAELESRGSPEQRAGVLRFRKSLARFVTMGSPLDKIAFLFGRGALRPWPEHAIGLQRREASTRGAERHDEAAAGEVRKGSPRLAFESGRHDQDAWWVNFYHALDPVSGALSAGLVCGGDPPGNIHLAGRVRLPGLAHMAYWRDRLSVRFILGRTYGKKVLPDIEFPPTKRLRYSYVAHLTWASLIVAPFVLLLRYLLPVAYRAWLIWAVLLLLVLGTGVWLLALLRRRSQVPVRVGESDSRSG